MCATRACSSVTTSQRSDRDCAISLAKLPPRTHAPNSKAIWHKNLSGPRQFQGGKIAQIPNFPLDSGRAYGTIQKYLKHRRKGHRGSATQRRDSRRAVGRSPPPEQGREESLPRPVFLWPNGRENKKLASSECRTRLRRDRFRPTAYGLQPPAGRIPRRRELCRQK
jgi:hypothetical protein